jgi:hypothetical protein
MIPLNVSEYPSPGNSQCGEIAVHFEKFQSLQSGLSVLASRYVGQPVHGDIVRMAAQVERIASRAGVR